MHFARSLTIPLVVVAAALPSAPAWAQGGGGGAAVPPGTSTPAPSSQPALPAAGGTTPGQVTPKQKPAARKRSATRKRPARPRGPQLSSFSLRRSRLFLFGRPARVSFRLKGRGDVLVRLRLIRKGQRRALRTISLGWRATGRAHSVLLTGAEAGALPQSSYVLRIAGRDRRGRSLRRAPRASSAAELSFFHHRFPVVGSFSYGGEGGRFGASRGDRAHRGQDLAAPAGTPLVAPRGGTVEVVGYQATGAGHYVVVDGRDEDHDYVFMHLLDGSTVVRQGQQVRTGQRIGQVGNTGRSFGAHLHFEVWTGGWFSKAGSPGDPLPLLRAWDSWS